MTSPAHSESLSSSSSINDPLHFFADIVADSPPLYSPSSSRTRPSLSPSPTRTSPRRTCLSSEQDTEYHPQTKKSSHKSSKRSALDPNLKNTILPRRQQLISRAQRIKTVENSPANPRQLRVLRMVYDEITNYPKEHWMALVAVIIHRSFNQIKHWFSNERQKSKSRPCSSSSLPLSQSTSSSTSSSTTSQTPNTNNTAEPPECIPCKSTDLNETIRMRPHAVDLCSEWSDEVFEATVMIYHFRCVRVERWQEQVQARAGEGVLDV